jgi:hypothetical protein
MPELDRFKKGLEEYGMTIESLMDWFYCGNNKDKQHYFFNHYPDGELPEKEENCVCGTPILVNHYLTDGKDNIIICGGCCISNFTDIKMGKCCLNCHKNHKNRNTDFCNKCRYLKFCSDCKTEVPKWETRCKPCKYDSEECGCGVAKKRGYLQCYACKVSRDQYWRMMNDIK